MQASSVHELFQRAVSISQKLDNELEKLDLLRQQISEDETTPQSSSNSNRGHSSRADEDIKQFLSQYRRWLPQVRSEVAKLHENCEHLLDSSDSLQNRFIILNTSYQELKSAVVELRASLKQGRDNIIASKKLRAALNVLENEQKLESTAVSKLQFIYNNTFSLNQQMEEKLRELQSREQSLAAELEWDIQKQVENESNWRDSDRYEKLVKQKSLICQHLGQVDEEQNNRFLQTFSSIQEVSKKIKDMDDVYKQLDINGAEQDLIIRQIMIREGITSDQLLGATIKQTQLLKQYEEASRLKISHAKPTQTNTQFYKHRPGKKPVKMYTEANHNSHDLSNSRVNNQSQLMRITARKKQKSLGANLNSYQSSKLHTKQIHKRGHEPSPQISNQSSTLLPKIHFGASEDIPPITHKQKTNSLQSMPLKSSYLEPRVNQAEDGRKRRDSDVVPFGQILSDASFIRIRTKKGASYHRSRLNQTSHKTKAMQREREEIVSLYDSLRDIHSDAKQFTGDDEADKSSICSKLSCEGNSSIAVKLPRKKKRNMADKNLIQSRQSDAEHSELVTGVMRLALNQNSKSNQKLADEVDNAEPKEEETRQRLKTIHENQEDNIRVSNK